jgi:hypothetical protein
VAGSKRFLWRIRNFLAVLAGRDSFRTKRPLPKWVDGNAAHGGREVWAAPEAKTSASIPEAHIPTGPKPVDGVGPE